MPRRRRIELDIKINVSRGLSVPRYRPAGRIRLRIKAHGCTASGRTASYFYIISTWRPRYYRPLLLLLLRRRSLLFAEACGIFGNRRSPRIHPASPLSAPLPAGAVSCFLEASHGIHTSEAPSLTRRVPHRYTPLCAGVYPIRAILILIKSAERIVWA